MNKYKIDSVGIGIKKQKLLPSRIELLTLGYPNLPTGSYLYETYVITNYTKEA